MVYSQHMYMCISNDRIMQIENILFLGLAIKTQPMSVVCEHGKPVTLTCVAQPTEGVYYQWYLNGSPQHR